MVYSTHIMRRIVLIFIARCSEYIEEKGNEIHPSVNSLAEIYVGSGKDSSFAWQGQESSRSADGQNGGIGIFFTF